MFLLPCRWITFKRSGCPHKSAVPVFLHATRRRRVEAARVVSRCTNGLLQLRSDLFWRNEIGKLHDAGNSIVAIASSLSRSTIGNGIQFSGWLHSSHGESLSPSPRNTTTDNWILRKRFVVSKNSVSHNTQTLRSNALALNQYVVTARD